MTYCYRCRVCNARFESLHRGQDGPLHCGQYSARDYRSENVAPQVVQLQREREAGGRRAIRDLFLPQQKDFAGPGDPDGSRGIRQWAEETKPKEGNKRPLWPDMPKKFHAVGG